ncbi:MmcQ/YjbR family DNA-binding protein [Streptomyces sp. NPDC093261]|uniref:MmcQ/YjbR family DNA-binding protein n=1 Tax=Streptomyces sp. NPDC093261 TaxID=3366037 RepID=UPI0037F99B1C
MRDRRARSLLRNSTDRRPHLSSTDAGQSTSTDLEEAKMHADRTVQNRAAARAAELPGSEHTHQFTGDWEVWKVGGKVFMLQTSMPGEPVVILKADPSDAETLRASHTSISPGYHMNKKHWITVRPGADIEQALVDDLVTESYLLVVAGLPRQSRPVDPDTFSFLPSAD